MKFKRISMIVITVLTVAMIVMSGTMKLIGSPDIVKSLGAAGVLPYRIGLGLAEILFAALFAYPKTMKIGFILLASYFAGAFATELSHHFPLSSLVPLVLVWLAAFLRDPAIFLPEATTKVAKA